MFTAFNAISHCKRRRVFVFAAFGLALAFPGTSIAQVQFEDAVKDLSNESPAVRLKTLQALREAGYPEAAVPISNLIIDKQDSIQLHAIATELDLFLTDKVTARKDAGEPAVEKRGSFSAEAAFQRGPLVVSLRPVPSEVLNALRVAANDENAHVASEALYAFGALTFQQDDASRSILQRVSQDDLVAVLEGRNSKLREAAARVIGRFYARRPIDPPVDAAIGDSLLAALNDKDRGARAAAMQALGDIRYEPAVQLLTDLIKTPVKGADIDAALDALARIASPQSAPLLKEHLTSKSVVRRTIAVEGLARLKGAVTLGEIQTALAKEQDDEVLLAQSFAATMLADAPIDQLGEALVRPRLRDQARRYLVELAPGHASRFSRHAKDPDTRIRVEVAEILTLAGDRSALPLVTPLAADQDPVVAFAGGRAVAQLRQVGAKPAS
jgi:HEAT repeat protein